MRLREWCFDRLYIPLTPGLRYSCTCRAWRCSLALFLLDPHHEGSTHVHMQDLRDKAEKYQRYTIIKCNAHYRASEIYSNKRLYLGVPATILSTVVATSIFASLSKGATSFLISFATGALSVVAAVLAALQTLLRYSELSTEHRRAAVSYESVRRRIDIFLLTYNQTDDREAALKQLEEITSKIDTIADAAPTVPDKMYDDVKMKLSQS